MTKCVIGIQQYICMEHETHLIAFTITYSTFEYTPSYCTCAAGNVIAVILQLAIDIPEQNTCSWNDAHLGTQVILIVQLEQSFLVKFFLKCKQL